MLNKNNDMNDEKYVSLPYNRKNILITEEDVESILLKFGIKTKVYDINLFNEVLNDKLKKLTKTYNNIILNIRKNYTTDADVLSSDSYFNEDLKRSFDNYSIVSSFYKTNNAKINEYIINIKDNDLDVTTIQPLEIMPIDGDDVVDEYRRSTSSDGSPQQQQARAGPNPIMQQQRQRRGEGATQVNSGKTLIRELSYKLANASELYNLSKISDINTVVKDIKHYFLICIKF